MKLRITVTQEDIDRGQQHCGTECPVLWALKRAFPHDMIDRVTRAYIVFKNGTRKKSPNIVKNFCKTFDCTGDVSPITFTLNV